MSGVLSASLNSMTCIIEIFPVGHEFLLLLLFVFIPLHSSTTGGTFLNFEVLSCYVDLDARTSCKVSDVPYMISYRSAPREW